MTRDELRQRWLAYLGGNPNHAGLGVFTIGFIIGMLGLAVAFLAPEPRGESAIYFVGFSIGVVAVLICFFGLGYHFVLMAKNNDA